MNDTRFHQHLLPLGITLLLVSGGCSTSGQAGNPANGGGESKIGGAPGNGSGASSLPNSMAGGTGNYTKVSTNIGGTVPGTSKSSVSSTTEAKPDGGASSSGGNSASKSSAGSSGVGGSKTSVGGAGQGGTNAKGGLSSIGGRSGSTTHAGGSDGAVGGKTSTGGIGSSNANTGGTNGSSTGAAPSGVTGLKVDANPKNVLSAYVSWTTDKAADSRVQFGQGKYEWEISDSALVTSHKVLIIGMYASKPYQIKAISANSGGSVNATTTYTTGALPSQIPVVNVTTADSSKVQPGWTLMNVIKSSSTMAPISKDPAMAVMYDLSGQPVWYYIDGTTPDYGGAIATHLTDKGVLLGPVVAQSGSGESPREVDFGGNTIWECKDTLCGGSGGITHDTIKLSNGNHVVVRWKAMGTAIDSDSTFEELDSDGKVVWSLGFGKLVPKPAGATGDWCHGNSITINIEKDEVYANCRFMGLIKAKYSDPNSLVWYLPASYGKATGNMAFSPTTSQYSDTHKPQPHDDGTIIFFDNGGYSASMFPSGGTTYHSRAVEYKIDEAKKTATLVWEFPGTFNVDTWYKSTWYNSYFGAADRLDNGNVLITAGSVSANNGDARVFEVTKTDGKVVWEFKLDAGYGSYRAARITPPLVKAIAQ